MTDEERLADLLLAWEESFEQGQVLPAEQLCRNCPELTAALAARISVLRTVSWVKQFPGSRDAERHPASTSPPGPRTLAGRYRLDELIAEGGYGKVWRGFDLELQRPVAVKLPRKRPGKADDEAAFLAEARKVARLKHPGIVPVHDVGRHEGAYFIVSELVEGQDVAERLRSKSFSVPQAVRLVAEAARHLHYAHQQGFIHRDIKPANLLVDAEDKVFITDFGIALTEAERHESGGRLLGTLAYMSPEQLHGDPARIDARTDIYSLGVVLYQLLTGRLPFEAETLEAMWDRILRQEPVPPRRAKTTTPKNVQRICLKCLAKSPTNRYPTAESLADDLSGWLKQRKTNWLLAGSGMVCCLLVGWFGIAKPVLMPDDRATALRLAVNPPAQRLGQERPLFNGRDTDGWGFISREYGEDESKKARLEEAIRVEDGVLRCREEPRYWLYSHESFGDFVLRVEYRFPHKPKYRAGNSILLRMTQPGPHHDAHVRVRLGGWATARILAPYEGILQDPEGIEPLPGLAGAERPTGEWNKLSIACVGGAIAVRINGVLVNQVHLAMAKEGRIGLAPQGCAVDFRKVAIAPLR